MKRFLLILTVLLLAACGEEPTPTATPTETAVPTRTIPPQPTATPTTAPTPTPLEPTLVVGDQSLGEDGRLLIDSVTVLEPAWVVIHAEREGQVGEVLGYTAVPAGTSEDVTVTIDPLAATDDLAAILHSDAGQESAFEFPGVDEPLKNGTAVVSQSFAIERDLELPALSVADQEVLEDGLVRVNSVTMPTPGWVVIHADDEGKIGTILGFTFVDAGNSSDVVVHIPWRQATPVLHAMLHEDNGRDNRFDFPDDDLDLPVLVAGEPVVAEFRATYPPDVLVLDQPVVDGTVTVERAISNGPGWLVVYQDNGGSPGLIIGSAPLEDGLNEQVTVNVREAGVTDQLFIFLHEDTEPGDNFNFPAADPQVTYQGRLSNPFIFQTNPGNYLTTQDQALTVEGEETAVTVPLVVLDAPGWVVIHTDNEGELGDIIGQTWVPAGINRNVAVTIDVEQATPTLYAVLHLDAGTLEEFEPDGADIPLQRNRAIIRSPFTIET
ncbi:MAG: hypothetical protein H6661_12130 [Ardenticatenaceae bacterium]|nr:hypothetical protein [Ardenticatenaceae bacterium]